jgi:hypothetical protein
MAPLRRVSRKEVRKKQAAQERHMEGQLDLKQKTSISSGGSD